MTQCDQNAKYLFHVTDALTWLRVTVMLKGCFSTICTMSGLSMITGASWRYGPADGEIKASLLQ